MSAAVQKFGHLVSKPAHTAAFEAHVVFSFVSKLYFQKNLFKSVFCSKCCVWSP